MKGETARTTGDVTERQGLMRSGSVNGTGERRVGRTVSDILAEVRKFSLTKFDHRLKGLNFGIERTHTDANGLGNCCIRTQDKARCGTDRVKGNCALTRVRGARGGLGCGSVDEGCKGVLGPGSKKLRLWTKAMRPPGRGKRRPRDGPTTYNEGYISEVRTHKDLCGTREKHGDRRNKGE